MSLNVQIQVPGLIRLAYPFQEQTLNTYARLNGAVHVDKDTLPSGTDFIKNQIPQETHSEVLPSHALAGKRYWIRTIKYFIDGSPIREVDYTDDEIPFYRFDEDYLPVFISEEEISAGQHAFQILATFFSIDNPGVNLFDVLAIDFIYDNSGPSLIEMLNRIAPPLHQGEVDVQLALRMLNYILVERTEGAMRLDIDGIEDLYDLTSVPDSLIPYLAATVGYDYFAGLLGNGVSVREELRFLPEWQKSAGTAASILTLLRAQRFDATIHPLYIDLRDNRLLRGGQARYAYQDQEVFRDEVVDRRLTALFTHGNHFVLETVVITFEARVTDTDGTISFIETFKAAWDAELENFVILFISDGTGSPSSPSVPLWLTYEDDGTPVLEEGIQSLFVDRMRRGLSMTFDRTVRVAAGTRINIGYEYELSARPGRQTRLSEFFDVDVHTNAGLNILTVSDYQRISDTVLRSKPLRTKLRQLTVPAKYGDLYVVNPTSYSSTGQPGNRDRLGENNIEQTAAQLNNPIRDVLSVRHKRTEVDGFLFSWELECDRWENRFSMFQSMEVDPAEYPTAYREQTLAFHTMLQRHYPILVGDDSWPSTLTEKERWLRQLDFNILNFKGGDTACQTVTDQTSHYYTIENDTPTSPAAQSRDGNIIELDVAAPISVANPVSIVLDYFEQVANLRTWDTITWEGADSVGFGTNGAFAVTPFDVAGTDRKELSWTSYGLSWKLTLIRFPVEADRDAFYVEREEMNNQQFEVGGSPEPKWYAILDVTGDFYTTPVHISATFSEVFANFQNACECCQLDLGEASYGSPSSFSFSETLGEAYRFYPLIFVEVVRVEDNKQVQLHEWTGGYWRETTNEDSNIDLTLNSMISGADWTLPLVLSGSASYVGPGPSGTNVPFNYVIRYCAKKAGDVLALEPRVSETDSFSRGILRRGLYGVDDENAIWFPPYSVKLEQLFDHKHNQVVETAAHDDIYFRNENLWPGLRYTIALDTPAAILEIQQMVYDALGNGYDGAFFYDETSPATKRYVQVLHFPKKLIFLTLNDFDIDAPFFYTPITPEDPIAWSTLSLDEWLDLLLDEWTEMFP